MGVAISPYAEDHVAAVKAFNARLRAGGADLTFPETPLSETLPKLAGYPVYDEHFLALDEGEVRGGYILKQQPFWLAGEVRPSAQFRLPLSEGQFDKRFASLGVQIYLDALRKQPLLYTIGLGGYEEAVSQMLVKAGWSTWPVPFYFRVLHAGNFLRNIVYLRTSPLRRTVLDTLAVTGLGTLAVAAYQAKKTRGTRQSDPQIEFSAEAHFGPWADAIWEASKGQYAMLAVRSAAVLNLLYPASDSRWTRLKVSQAGQVVGWAAVLSVPMQDHNYFGNMRVGSLIDCLALPGQEHAVTAAVMRFMHSSRADIVVTNLTDDRWCRALEAVGMFQGPSNYILATSKNVTKLIEPFDDNKHRVHMTRGDGAGAGNLITARK